MTSAHLGLVLLASVVTSHATTVGMEAIPLLTEVEPGHSAQQSIMLRLELPDAQDSSEAHLNYDQDLIIVLDVSGSMRSGAKLEKAKAAIAGIVNGLRPNDHVHLVTYHSSARIEFTGGTAEKKEELLAHVAELSPQSSTNLYAGLEAAATILDSHSESNLYSSVKRMFNKAAESDSPSVKRIFLFSDGLVNSGVTDRRTILEMVERLRQRGATTSAFGIGADYDSQLMSAIAEAGHGEFFFIRGQEDMEKVIRVATVGFQSLFGTDAQVRLTALNGATGLHVYGQNYHREAGESSIRVTLGDLRAGDARTILADLMLPGLNETTECLSYELQYIAMGATHPTTQRGHVTVRVAENGAQPAEPSNAVLLFRKLQQHLLREAEVEREIESGDLRSAAGLEDDLEEDLRDVARVACSSQDTREEAYTCSRATAAWGRTKQSQKLFENGGMHNDIASKTYKFKRQMNAELSVLKDEL